ncbi:MAG: hypothetical protein HYW01_08485 [Deltaproteobacteria bacterium]|nr:hypothetical protein [Deltaproteobacteria bacterium]
MNNDEKIKELQVKLEEIRKAKKEVEDSFSHVPDVRRRILLNLPAQERFLIELIKEKHNEGQ